MHPTRAFAAPLYRGFLQLFVSLLRVLVLQTRRGQVSSAVQRLRSPQKAGRLALNDRELNARSRRR
jgi:hypothetical protein